MSQGVLGTNLFAYCLNNPVNLSDPSGRKPGDLFDTIDEAAEDFARCYNGASISDNREYATAIYRVLVDVQYKIIPDNRSWILRMLFPKTVASRTQIISVTYKYTYTTIKKGSSDSVSAPSAPLFKTRVATAHTHAAYDPKYANDIFSSSDKNNAAKRGVPNYVATPLGTLRRYDPADGSDIVLFTDIPFDSNHPSR